MSPSSTTEAPSATARPGFSTATLVAVGVWACAFALFVVLGLRS